MLGKSCVPVEVSRVSLALCTMPRIDFTAPLVVTNEEDRVVNDWATLREFVGRSFENTDALGYFGQSIDEVPVAVLLDRSGNIREHPNSGECTERRPDGHVIATVHANVDYE